MMMMMIMMMITFIFLQKQQPAHRYIPIACSHLGTPPHLGTKKKNSPPLYTHWVRSVVCQQRRARPRTRTTKYKFSNKGCARQASLYVVG